MVIRSLIKQVLPLVILFAAAGVLVLFLAQRDSPPAEPPAAKIRQLLAEPDCEVNGPGAAAACRLVEACLRLCKEPDTRPFLLEAGQVAAPEVILDLLEQAQTISTHDLQESSVVSATACRSSPCRVVVMVRQFSSLDNHYSTAKLPFMVERGAQGWRVSALEAA